MSHKLKITLQHSEPKITRTVIIPEDFSFHQLHTVIQCVMNWNNAHLYQFNTGAAFRSDTIALEDEEDEEDDFGFSFDSFKKINSEETKVSDYFNNNLKKMLYIYDFGDDWRHIISVQKKPNEDVLFPRCVKGENAAPMEDCGGIWRHENLLEISHKKRKSSEEKEMLEWYGIPTDKTFEEVYPFDIDTVNKILLKVFSS